MRKRAPTDIHPKVAAAGIGGAVVTLLNAVLHATTGYNPTPVEVAAEVTVVSFAAGYLKPSAE